jgi:8-oxo-dGTP diphosphatase
MLHRVKKKNDINEGKWIAPGGHCEKGESPEDCAIREVREETGIELRSVRFRGIVTFITLTGAECICTGDKGQIHAGEQVCGEVDITEYMCLFTSDDFDYDTSGAAGAATGDCDEGVLEWISKDGLFKLNLWEGDKIFLDLIRNPRQPFFSLKLTYQGDELKEAVLDGKVL